MTEIRVDCTSINGAILPAKHEFSKTCIIFASICQIAVFTAFTPRGIDINPFSMTIITKTAISSLIEKRLRFQFFLAITLVHVKLLKLTQL